jgi:beta-lactamase regulating signal transducer with metallopeptidase domain
MPFLFQYLFKLTICLAMVYLFYHFLLRRLTFYHHNRWYLSVYTLLSFFIPFINISPVLEKNKLADNKIVQLFPNVNILNVDDSHISNSAFPAENSWTRWDWILLIFSLGFLILITRFLFQYLSFYRMRRQAQLISDKGMKLYQVNKTIIPFSFGRSIFINRARHNEQDLEEIIRHEFVHVKQRHTIDIIWAEFLCAVNWFNPFAWLLSRAIRENLEFIADNKVVESGIDKKQYQYLLLKVIGIPEFSIASQFNFSSLKKRIAMMNKVRTAKLQLLKSLFILPVIAVLLLAFRNNIQRNTSSAQTIIKTDTIPQGKAVAPQDENEFLRRHTKIERIGWGHVTTSGNDQVFKTGDVILQVYFKSGKSEVYNLRKQKDIEEFQKSYGELPPSPPSDYSVTTNNEYQVIKPVAISNEADVAIATPDVALTVATPVTVASTGKVSTTVALTSPVVASAYTNINANTTIATDVAEPVNTVVSADGNVAIASTVPVDAGEKIMELNIYKTTKRSALDKLISEAKTHDVELEFDDIQYNDKGQLISISGNMKKDGSHSNFNANGFEFVRLILFKKDERYSIRVFVSSKKEVI